MIWPSVDGQTWNGEIHGWVFRNSYRRILLKALRTFLRTERLSKSEIQTFNHRAQSFISNNLSGRVIPIRFGNSLFTLQPSGKNGHCRGNLTLTNSVLKSLPAKNENTVTFQTFSDSETSPSEGRLHLIHPEGLSIISDIDDTIKETHVTDRRDMLMNTFCRPFRPVEGMAERYQSWATHSTPCFHYISSSPYQLYTHLSEFLTQNQFPAGTFHLKTFRLKDSSLFDLFQSPETYKKNLIRPLLERFPKRKFILIGDSNEKDPEIYADLARNHPEQILRIFIRDTRYSNNPNRYKQIFRGIKTSAWQIFQDASELPQNPFV